MNEQGAMKPKLILGLFSGALFLIVLLQNAQVVSLRFLFWELSMSRIIFFPLLIILGIVIGFIIGKNSDHY